MKINCDYCNKEYNIPTCWYNRTRTHCCSVICACELKKKNNIKICKYCGKEFYSKNHQKIKLYCNNKCASKVRENKITLICNICNKEYIVNKYRSKISKFCSRECTHVYVERKLSLLVGLLNPKWKGFGDTKRKDKSKLKSWSLEIKRRDKVCRECGSVHSLQSHHIKSYREYPELRFDLNNGILLCSKCHGKKHVNDNKKVIHLIEWQQKRKIG